MNYIIISSPTAYKSNKYVYALYRAEQILFSDEVCAGIGVEIIASTDDIDLWPLPSSKKNLFNFYAQFLFGDWHNGIEGLFEYDNNEDAIEAFNIYHKLR